MKGIIPITLGICWICMSFVTMPVQAQNSPLPSHGVDAHQSSQQDNPVSGVSDMAPSPEMPDAAAPPPSSPNESELKELSDSSQTNTQPPAGSGDNLTNAPDVQTNSMEINPVPDPNYKELPNEGASVHSEMEKPLPPILLGVATNNNFPNAQTGETNSPPGLQR